MNRLEKRTLRLIKVGAENATPASEITRLLKVNPRTVRSIIYRHVTRYGYYIPRDKEELLEGARSLYNQNQEEQKRLTVLLNASLTDWQDYLKEG